jgi:uncharacterized small protein (DUF1192 family)
MASFPLACRKDDLMGSGRKTQEVFREGLGGRMVLAAMFLLGLAALGCQQAPEAQRPQPPPAKASGQPAQKPTPSTESDLEKPLARTEEKALPGAKAKPSASAEASPSGSGEAAPGPASGKTEPQAVVPPEDLLGKTPSGPEKPKIFPSSREPIHSTPPDSKTMTSNQTPEEEENPFDPKEIERRRKMIEEEMERLEAEWREKQKKRIAELGPPLVENADKLIRLHPVFPVWADRDNKRIILVGEVCKREGLLEMFACLRRTKEHESIVVVDTTAQIVHAGLLAIGAEAGRPVQFQPTYRPATGDEIEVTVVWKDKEGRQHTARAQDWVRHTGTKKPMEHPWVFAGSMFSRSEETGQVSYMADGGDFICVSNFPTAMLDLPVASSNLNAELEFEAFTERIPPEGTPVTLILTPKKKTGGPGSSTKPSEPSPKASEPKAQLHGSSPEKPVS